MWQVATSRRRRNVSERASDIGTVHTQVDLYDLALRFVDSCVYARRSGVRIRRNLCIHTHRSRKRTDPRIHTSHPGGCIHIHMHTPAAYTHPPLAYTHRPAYTHPGAYMHPLRIRTHHSRKRTHPRIRTLVCIRTRCVYTPTARVNAPARVYAPDAAYTRGRDERHASVPPHPMTMLPYLLLLLLLRLLLPLRRVRASTSISTSCP